MKCGMHKEEYGFQCNWCGTKICQGCIEEAHGKKYCADCNTKVSKTPRFSAQEGWGSAPAHKITNRDESLDENRIQQIRNKISRAH